VLPRVHQNMAPGVAAAHRGVENRFFDELGPGSHEGDDGG